MSERLHGMDRQFFDDRIIVTHVPTKFLLFAQRYQFSRVERPPTIGTP